MRKLIFFAISFAIVMQAQAETMHRNQRVIKHRLNEGFQDGSLTRDEAEKVSDKMDHIREMRQDALADDGKIDAQERHEIKEEQRELKEKIHDLRHNGKESDGKSHSQLRQFKQRQSIKQGVQDGSLTADEARYLTRQVNATKRAIKRARRDGVVTHAERQQIGAMQDANRQQIYQERHDGDQGAGAR